MAYADTLPTAHNAAIAQLLANDEALLICQAGTTAPASPDPGTLWFDTNTGVSVLKVWDGSAWVAVSTVIKDNPDFNLKQLLNARLENVTSSLTPGATNIGRAVYHTNEKAVQLVKDATTLGRIMVGDAAQYIIQELPLETWKLRSTPPTANTIGTTPVVDGLLFDADGEKASNKVVIPVGYTGAHNAKLRLYFWLEVTEVAGDDIDVQMDYIVAELSSADVLTKTSTNKTATKDLGATVTAGSIFSVDIELVYNDATNPLVAGEMLFFDIHRNGLAEVAGANLWHARMLWPFGGTLLAS